MKLATMLVLWVAIPSLAATWPAGWHDADADSDGISDAYEAHVAKVIHPIFFPDTDRSMRPGSLRYFLEHCDATKDGVLIKRLRSMDDALSLLERSSTAGVRLKPAFDAEHGDTVVANDSSWKGDKRPTVFFRVTRFPADKCVYRPLEGHEYVCVQFCYWCFFSDADFLLNLGDHDGDICMVDVTLVVKAPPGSRAAAATYQRPVIDSVICHQHGRQAFYDQLYHGKLELKNGRICIMPEGNSNEPWCSRGGMGIRGWPAGEGFLANHRWEKDQGIPSPEQEAGIVRSHLGRGAEISDYVLLNLGERSKPMPDPLCRFVMGFRGVYGDKAVGVPGIYDNDPPTGWPFQHAMWDRDFSKYGWFDRAWMLKVAGTEQVEQRKLDRHNRK